MTRSTADINNTLQAEGLYGALQDMEDATASTSATPVELSWTASYETLLVEWADKAQGYRWQHEQVEALYRTLCHLLSVPVVLISSLCSTVNITVVWAAPDCSAEGRAASIVLGVLSFLAAALSAVSSGMRVPQLMEAHRHAAQGWGKLHRVISTELALRRDQRVKCDDFVKLARAEYERLLESAPAVPTSVITRFKHTFGEMRGLHLPENCVPLAHTAVCNDSPPRGGFYALHTPPPFGQQPRQPQAPAPPSLQGPQGSQSSRQLASTQKQALRGRPCRVPSTPASDASDAAPLPPDDITLVIHDSALPAEPLSSTSAKSAAAGANPGMT